MAEPESLLTDEETRLADIGCRRFLKSSLKEFLETFERNGVPVDVKTLAMFVVVGEEAEAEKKEAGH